MSDGILWGKLDENNNVVSCTAEEMSEMIVSPRKIVGTTKIGSTWVSTVFLCINHGFLGRDLWFETMVFTDRPEEKYPETKDQERYTTWKEAERGHRLMVIKWEQELGMSAEDTTSFPDLLTKLGIRKLQTDG